jgi:hypothetical protein
MHNGLLALVIASGRADTEAQIRTVWESLLMQVLAEPPKEQWW